ncbi:ComF family protein [Leptobacterium sp. I13]|uniref:ComF family protein n=1 Tax=Leptobacterium meishanense TaxID=3128904 RepID=UPI0030EE5032
MINILNDIETLFFPPVCPGCDSILLKNEKTVCVVCRHQLPLTNYHAVQGNPVEKIFYGRVEIVHATAFLAFQKKGLAQRLIHQLKYKGNQAIGGFIGEWMGSVLMNNFHYQTVDVVVPVPLHPKKLRKRGYNQVSAFGKKIAGALNASYNDDALIRVSHSKTQTFKNRIARWNNASFIFDVEHPGSLKGKHILLIDDVITTGATLEACAITLQKIENVQISIATMAITI